MSDANIKLRDQLKHLQFQLQKEKAERRALEANPPMGAQALVGHFTEDGVQATLLAPATSGRRPPSQNRPDKKTTKVGSDQAGATRVLDTLEKKPELLEQVMFLAIGRGFVQDALVTISQDNTPIASPWATTVSAGGKKWYVRRRLVEVEEHTFQNPLAAEVVTVEGDLTAEEFDWHTYDPKHREAHPDSTKAKKSGTAKKPVEAMLAVDDDLRCRGWVLL